jgi:hypothetical protein
MPKPKARPPKAAKPRVRAVKARPEGEDPWRDTWDGVRATLSALQLDARVSSVPDLEVGAMSLEIYAVEARQHVETHPLPFAAADIAAIRAAAQALIDLPDAEYHYAAVGALKCAISDKAMRALYAAEALDAPASMERLKQSYIDRGYTIVDTPNGWKSYPPGSDPDAPPSKAELHLAKLLAEAGEKPARIDPSRIVG